MMRMPFKALLIPVSRFAALCLPLSFASCVTLSEGRMMQADIQTLKSQLDAFKKGTDEDREALRLALVRAEKKTLEVSDAIERINAVSRKNSVDQGGQLDSMSRTLQEIVGRLDDAQMKLELADRRMKALEGTPSVSSVLTPASAAPVSNSAAPAAPSPQAVTPSEPPAANANPPATDAPAQMPKVKKAAFDFVLSQLRSSSKPEEAKGFVQEFVTKWPKEAGLTDAIFMAVGDKLLEQKSYQKAIVEYKKVLDNFAKGELADNAMFQIAQTFAAMGYKDDAKVFYETLLERYPKSELIASTKQKITQLEKAAAPTKKKNSTTRNQ